jgi:ribosome maturation factor RimP
MRSFDVEQSTERLWGLLEPYARAEGVELDDLDVRGGGGPRTVRVLVDADGGVDVDRIADLARGMSRLLDEADPFDGSYTLEVGSPGLERALRRPAHFRKSVGREVTIATSEPIDGTSRHRGVIEGAGEDTVTIREGGTLRVIPLEMVAKARTVFRWERSEKPGGKQGRK